MLGALEAGRIVPVEEHETLSDGTLGAIEAGSATFPICQQVIDARVVVSETEIAAALLRLAQTHDLMVEGAAGVALAGLVKSAAAYQGRKVAVVLCGRNIGPQAFITGDRGTSVEDRRAPWRSWRPWMRMQRLAAVDTGFFRRLAGPPSRRRWPPWAISTFPTRWATATSSRPI